MPQSRAHGGEPLLHEAELLELMGNLRGDEREWFFEIETNGTRLPEADFLAAIDQLNVSPKLANSGVGIALRRKPEVLVALARSGKAWFKFVVQNEADISEVWEIVKQSELPLERLILMPEGRTVPELDQTATWLAEKCRDLGVRFSDRLHIRLWGDKRGV